MSVQGPDLSIIVVNYNAKQYLEACLASIQETASGLRYELLVADNGSRDGSVEALRGRFPWVTWVLNEGNVGYARANNQGLEVARGRYLLLLNNDTIVLPSALARMIAFLEERPKAGIVGCKVLNPDGTVQGTARSFPGVMNALFGRHTLLTRAFPENRFYRRYILSRDEGPEGPMEVDWVSAACLLARREVYQDVGPLDEDFPLYFVDTDWCRRAKARGWQVWYDPGAEIVHHEHKGGTRASRRQVIRMTMLMHTAAYRYFCKYHGGMAWHPMRLVAFLGLALKASVAVSRELLRGHHA
jgi:GT2 family glycosyltransferase